MHILQTMSIKKSIWLCIDPKDLNEALEREPYYSRTIDELISMFAGAKVFTIVDMDKGYWQVVLHPESRKYTCMAFDIGRYQFKRLPMGSKVASNIFQRMLDSVYIGLPGVTGIADDMVIFGRNEEEHDRNLILFLETTRKNGLILNKRKLQFKKEEVSFFGHRWNSTGISPDPKKTESILKMQFPPDKETMHSFLGLVNFLNRYTPRLAELCSPLRKLILKDSHYSPGDPEHAAFDAIKAEFQKKIILPYFWQEQGNYSTNWCEQERFWCSNSTRRTANLLCFEGTHICREELPESWTWGSSSCVGHGEIPLFSLW